MLRRIYLRLAAEIPEAQQIAKEEELHEEQIVSLLDEDRLRYVGSMVLGLNDALAELTGTLAGLTFALRSTKLVALSDLLREFPRPSLWPHPSIYLLEAKATPTPASGSLYGCDVHCGCGLFGQPVPTPAAAGVCASFWPECSSSSWL